jgi:hypothetical protein
MLKGKLYLAPVPTPQRVLDVGTGTGIWVIEFGMNPCLIMSKPILTLFRATQNPSADVLGIDLSPIQPELLVDLLQR